MLDIETILNGGTFKDSDIFKANNILTTQIGSLYFLPEFGIDIDLFFSQDYSIQFESFQSYITDKMVQAGINISKINTSIDTFTRGIIMTIGGSKNAV